MILRLLGIVLNRLYRCWKNAYPQKFIDKCIQKFLNNIFTQRLQVPSVLKKELRITLPYLGKKLG